MTYVSNKLYSITLSGSILKYILEKYIIHFMFFSFWLLLILVSQKEFLIYQIFWCIINKWTPGYCFKIRKLFFWLHGPCPLVSLWGTLYHPVYMKNGHKHSIYSSLSAWSMLYVLSHFSHAWLFVTLWTVAL